MTVLDNVVSFVENGFSVKKMNMLNNKDAMMRWLRAHDYRTPNRSGYGKQEMVAHTAQACRPSKGNSSIRFFAAGETVPKIDEDVEFCEDVLPGNHYRVGVHNGEVKAVFQRMPVYIVGDGATEMSELVRRANLNRSSDDQVKLDNITSCRKDYVPADGESVACNLLSNYSGEGGMKRHIEITELPLETHAVFRKLAKDLDMGLFSVDVICIDITLPPDAQSVWAIENVDYTGSASSFRSVQGTQPYSAAFSGGSSNMVMLLIGAGIVWWVWTRKGKNWGILVALMVSTVGPFDMSGLVGIVLGTITSLVTLLFGAGTSIITMIMGAISALFSMF